VGDRIAGNFLRFCGSCGPCRDGRQQFCENIADYNRPGMAETVTWHESQVYRLPDSVSLRHGCLLEPTSVAVRIADKARPRVGDRVAICGGGPIGQLALQVMRLNGATSLTMIEPIAERRELASASGAEHVIDPINEDQAARAAEITGGRGYDVVIDASGSTRAVRGLLDLAAKGGTVVYGAMYPHDFEMPLNLSDYLYLKELTLTGVFVSPYAFPRAVQLLPLLDLEALTATWFPLDQAVEAFAEHMSGRHPKVLIRCNDVDEADA
jgi:(R,R)-butanediol dehydrogenase/meso-butanediol dehydrogenase/diacetyl reductase/L-iditol 2-dehydrogenase